ncbi:FAD-dependent oxidoreductase [Sphingosinicella sp. LHD-64]|uniref:FAD/NAD(P)-binding protein n=1 Tax=Sphingosinicella sp. LHD-64 TaxID=3072139 RepID=UPI00281083F6|nr:FAD-dependent oxidoreductase [Sphingosinicella sp. LHD-64]MDQ8756095.1 FAD-dependent oxidoreductase [Sphingosinicella sp. LHD-64]
MTQPRIAVIGAGASGTIQALHLLRRGAGQVALIERERVPGRGTAYGTTRPEHLLNVPANKMIVYPDDPGHFARWFAPFGGAPDDYAPRMLFGDYLCELKDAAGDAIEVIGGEAVDVVPGTQGEEIRLADGGSLHADAVILALGNLRPATPPGIDPDRLGSAYVDDPWFGGFLEGLGDQDMILLLGTGLTAIDAALTLDATGFRGRILSLSRRGLAPRPHIRKDDSSDAEPDYPGDLSWLLNAFRKRSDVVGWRVAVQEMRPVTQTLWTGAPLPTKLRFLRHLRPWWDVHRHRIAPAVAERIAAMESEGRLTFAAGRARKIAPDGHGLAVSWQPRGSKEVITEQVRYAVNCTGPDLGLANSGDPLLATLRGAGRIRPDPCRLGLNVDAGSRVIDAFGNASPSLSAIGPITRGAFWESIAVPDISVQARDLAERLLG